MTSTLSSHRHDASEAHGADDAFRHEAFFYAGPADFVEGTTTFVEEGLRAGESVMIALPSERLELLRTALGEDAGRVAFADMADIGRNPARIIPAWRRFVETNDGSGRAFRGIGEPIFPARRADELTECQLHEVLLNVAFDGLPAWRLLCPYGTEALDRSVLDEARRSHPYIYAIGSAARSDEFRSRAGPQLLEGSLPDPPRGCLELGFDARSLPEVRHVVARWAAPVLRSSQVADVMLAVHEIATNSVRHGGGTGVVRCWQDGAAFVCEVSDRGHVGHDLVGREVPALEGEFGRGMWLANQLCDLVQVRNAPTGAVVRLRLGPA